MSHILVIQAALDGCFQSTEGFFNWIEEQRLSLALFMVNLLDLI